MQGKKYPPDVVEKALALYATCENYEDVAKQLNIPQSTIRGWVENPNKNKEFAELREKKKREFVEVAWRIIEKANKLLEQKMDVALNHQKELRELLTEMSKSDVSAVNYNELSRKVKAIEIDNLSSLTTAIGTLYDKQALCNKEATQITGVKKLEDFDD